MSNSRGQDQPKRHDSERPRHGHTGGTEGQPGKGPDSGNDKNRQPGPGRGKISENPDHERKNGEKGGQS